MSKESEIEALEMKLAYEKDLSIRAIECASRIGGALEDCLAAMGRAYDKLEWLKGEDVVDCQSQLRAAGERGRVALMGKVRREIEKTICPTCEGEVKFEIIDGKCKACRLGVVPDWAKDKEYVCPNCQYRGMKERHPKLGVYPLEWCEVVEKRLCPSRTGTRGDVACTLEAGHESLWHTDGLAIRWRD